MINFINDVFEEIMDGYDENARLYPGDPDAEKVPVSAGDADADRATAQPCLYLAQDGCCQDHTGQSGDHDL